MNKNRVVLLLCGIFAADASAAIRTYTNRAAWAAAIGQPTTIDFGTASPPAQGSYTAIKTPPGLTLSGVNFGSTKSGGFISVASQSYCCTTYRRGYDSLASSTDGTGIAVTLPTGINAVGFDLFAVNSADSTGQNQDSIDVTVGGQKLVVKTIAAPGIVFIGVVSDAAIPNFTIIPEQTPSAAVQVDVINFAFGTGVLNASTIPTVTGVLNGADFSSHLSPGVLVAVYGSNFGSGPASMVTATVSGKQAAVVAVTPTQLTVQLPVDAPTGATSLIVTIGGVSSTPFPITLDNFAPAIITADGSGSGPGLIRMASGSTITSVAPAHVGDNLVAYLVGLGATNPPFPTGTTATAQAPTTTIPTLTVGGVPATVAYAGAAPGLVGTYQINFTVPAGLQGTQPVVVSIGGKNSSAVPLALFGITSMANNASFGSVGTVSPGSIASIFANGLGANNQTVGFPGTTFQGVSVTLNGIPAPLFHMIGTAGQIDLLVPYELATSGKVPVQVKTASGTSLNYTVALEPATPGMYFLADPSTIGRFNALAQLNNTAWLIMPDAMAAALKIPGNCTASNYDPAALCGQPATAGDYLVLYVTGLGKATPGGDPNGVQLKTGDSPPANGSILYQTVTMPTVTVGGLPATVVFSGIAPGFPGLYQIDFQVPKEIAGDDVPVAVSIGGSLVDTRTIAIR